MGVNRATTTVLERIKALAPEIAARADETETNRGIAADLIEKLRVVGVFRMMLPKKLGGEQLSQLQACEIIEELARADAAAGWTAMIAFGFNVVFSRFPREIQKELFSGGPDVLTRGALAPIGTAIPTQDGYMISGRWPFASGSYEPQWIVGGCTVIEGGKPRKGPDGAAEILVALLPAKRARFLDTWYSVGLRGSDSTDVEIENQFVPKDFTTNVFNPFVPSAFDIDEVNIPIGYLTGPTHSAVCLGIVQGALDDLGVLARTKRSAFNPGQRLAEDMVFKHRYGELLVRLDSIRALTDHQIAEAAALSSFSPESFARNGARVGYVHVQSVDIVNEAFSLAGSTPVYSKSAIQRRWRDIRCVAQHFGGSTSAYRTLGGMMAGEGSSDQPTKATIS